MTEIVKAYRQEMPALRFIGKRYGDADRQDGSFGAKWGEWFQNGWFEQLEKATDRPLSQVWADGDAYIGLMRAKDGEPFQYWIGMFLPPDTTAPEGFEAWDFPASALGVAWVRGKEENGEVYGKEGACIQALKEAGIDVTPKPGCPWLCFERYACPRFTTKDENGQVILDICFVIG